MMFAVYGFEDSWGWKNFEVIDARHSARFVYSSYRLDVDILICNNLQAGFQDSKVERSNTDAFNAILQATKMGI